MKSAVFSQKQYLHTVCVLASKFKTYTTLYISDSTLNNLASERANHKNLSHIMIMWKAASLPPHRYLQSAYLIDLKIIIYLQIP